jgi:hypothetical protein
VEYHGPVPSANRVEYDPDKVEGQSYLEFGASGIRILVPDDEVGEDRALVEALNGHPVLLERAE